VAPGVLAEGAPVGLGPGRVSGGGVAGGSLCGGYVGQYGQRLLSGYANRATNPP
jgi:hypothetical protein